MVTKVIDTEIFPQRNIAGLISGITFIVLFSQEKPLWWKEINTHTHTHMLQINETIWHKIFAEWVLLNTEIFSRLDLKHDDKFFPYKFLEGFVKIGHELADIIIDSTEFKLQ